MHGQHNASIAMGNGRTMSGFRGGKNVAPVVKLINHAQKRIRGRGTWLDVNEHSTTKLVTCCFTEAEYMRTHDNSKINGIQHCQCGNTLNRDASASINIMKIALHNTGHVIRQDMTVFPGAN